MSDGGRIVLGEEDFEDVAPPPAAEAQIPAPPALPPVARREPVSIGTPVATSAAAPGTSPLNHPVFAALFAAAAGVFVGWLLGELLIIPSYEKQDSVAGAHFMSGLWVGVVGATLGGALLTYDRAFAGAWEDAGRRFAAALVPMAIVGFISGYLANVLYVEIMKQADFEDVISGNSFVVYLARSVGWAIFGIGIGGTVGLLAKSRDRAINGAIGGAIGGAVGGLIFQFVASKMQTGQGTARLLGLAAVGLLIAYAMRMVEKVRRDAWLHITAGGMAGKEFVIYHDSTRIGSSPDCEIFLLKDPAISPFHARLDDVGGQRTLVAVGDSPVYINEVLIQSQVLRSGDSLRLGQTVIAYSERDLMSATPSSI